ncbi:MAG: archaetidylserine decarboxylase [Gammaproteobacteria bacterium]
MSLLWDYIRVLPQFLLPRHALSGMVYRITRCEWPPLKNFLIRAFIAWFKVDIHLAAQTDSSVYRHFNQFFTRALKAGARPLAGDADSILCPVDGRISQIGRIRSGEIFQAKRRSYDLATLLAGDREAVSNFTDGSFATLYLSPRDYHRVHMPLAGALIKMTYVPGRLFAVNTHTTRIIDKLFARNERVISIFDTVLGPMAVVLVGAVNVGSMETVWAGAVTPARKREITSADYHGQKIVLKRGEEMGRFNMGSTVILLFAKDRVQWLPHPGPEDQVTLGMALGKKQEDNICVQ